MNPTTTTMAFTPPKLSNELKLPLPTMTVDHAPPPTAGEKGGLTLPVLLSDQQPGASTSSFCRPVICEQGPSGPNSPTTPRLKRPSPITPEAMRRIHLLTADPAHLTYDPSKLSPLSPSLSQYQTSDLGSSPRSSITGSLISPIPASAFTHFRDMKKSSSDFTDADSDYVCKDSALHSPASVLPSPAPFSPYSDSAFLEAPDASPSGLGKRPAGAMGSLSSTNSQRSLYFSFDETSLAPPEQPYRHSSASIHAAAAASGSSTSSNLLAVPQVHMCRNRSASDGDMGKQQQAAAKQHQQQQEEADLMDTSSASTPQAADQNSGGQFKKRLLHKYEKEQEGKSETETGSLKNISTTSSAGPPLSSSVPRPNMFSSNPSISDALHGKRFEAWMSNQLKAWQSVWYSGQTGAGGSTGASGGDGGNNMNNLLLAAGLIGPSTAPTSLIQPPAFTQPQHHNSRCKGAAPGAIKTWRRSRSESDVQGAHVCEQCGQAFGVYERLTKHVSSRHRDRSVNRASASSSAQTAAGAAGSSGSGGAGGTLSAGTSRAALLSVGSSSGSHRPHKCHVCPKSFGRSDMLTRHMRLHTGIKPYACHVCGQEFSRSDHLSTHQRTHTGEKPYQCPQCSYAASRRDMITRHMRTHSRMGGPQLPLVVQRTTSNPVVSSSAGGGGGGQPQSSSSSMMFQQRAAQPTHSLPLGAEQIGQLAGSIQSIQVDRRHPP